MHINLPNPFRSSWVPQAISLALVLAVTVGESSVWAQRFVPGDRGLPGRREGGGTRGGCVQNQLALTALMPDTNLGLTTKANPTLLWYVPATEARAAEFVLLDETNTEVYQSLVQLTGEPGVVSLSLPPDSGLQAGKTYQWYFSVICDAEDRSGDVTTEGWIQRIAPSAALVDQLETAPESDRPTLYAEAGIWYDALSTLAELRRANPDNRTFASQWRTLLASVGLEGLSEQPLTACCQSIALQPAAIPAGPQAPLRQ